MQKQNILNSPRLLELKKHRRRVFLNKILLSLAALVVIFLSLSYLSHLKQLNIREIEIIGNKMLDTEAIREVVARQIAGEYIWLFPKTNIFFYPENNIKNELQDKFKRLNNISLAIKNNKTIEVSLSERTALYTWCGVVPELAVKPPSELGGLTAEYQPCYFLDEDGYVFDEAPYFSGNIYFKFYGPLDEQQISSSAQSPLGAYFLRQNFKQLNSFKDILTGLDLKPVALYITNDRDVEIFLLKKTSSISTTEPKIIFKLDADFQNVAENLQAALNTEPLKSKFKNKYSSLSYIDLRFGNKVYDKFSN